jgi:hypothetical protein
MGKIRVFISSSLTELESEREIAQKTLTQLNLEPVMFENLPAMDKPLENAYIDAIKDSHIFIIILWKDLTEAVEREYNTASDLEIPILMLVKIPTFRETRTQRLENLINIAANQNAQINRIVPFRKNFRTLTQLEHELKEGVTKLVSDKFTGNSQTTTNIDLIRETNLQMIQNARRKLLIVAKTPILLLGPRPYCSTHKNLTKDKFHQALTNWIETMKNDERKKMIYLYSLEDTYKEMKENHLEHIVRTKLEKYKKIEEETNERFVLSSIKEFPGRICISDNNFAISFRAQKGKIVYINHQDSSFSTDLFQAFVGYPEQSESTLPTLLKQLKLQ